MEKEKIDWESFIDKFDTKEIYSSWNESLHYKPISEYFNNLEDLNDSFYGKIKNIPGIKSACEELSKWERARKDSVGYIVSCAGPPLIPMRNLIPQSPETLARPLTKLVVSHAITLFNSTVPREGICIFRGSSLMGRFWGLELAADSSILAKISPSALDEYGKSYFMSSIWMNGVKLVKKPEKTLSKLIIERIFIKKDNEEQTIHSTL